MSKLKVVLLVGAGVVGAAAVAGYVFRHPLEEKVDELMERLEIWIDNRDQALYFKLSEKYNNNPVFTGEVDDVQSQSTTE